MPTTPEARFLDFSGGLNADVTKSVLPANQCSVLVNMFPLHGRLQRRPAAIRVPLSGANPLGQCYGLFDYQGTDGTHYIIHFGASTISKVLDSSDATSALSISNAESSVFPATVDSNWRAVEFNSRGYAIRPDIDFIVAFDLTMFTESGLAAPSSAPTLAGVAGGAVEAGNYYGVVTFYDAVNTSYESNPSPVSAVVTLDGTKNITWTNIPVSSDPRCGGRRLYRTIFGQTGEYYLVVDIPNNTATSYTPDTATLDDYGAQASFRNGVFPPKYWIDIKTAFNRLWLTDGRYVYFSEDGAPESFYSTNFIDIDPDSGEKIIGLSTLGDSLLVHRSRSLWAINQSAGIFPFLPQKLDENHGCEVTLSIQSAGGYSLWYHEASVYSSAGGVAIDIASDRVRTILKAIPVDHRQSIISGVLPDRNWYMLSIPATPNSTQLNKLLVYNYKDKNWTVFTYQARYAGFQLAPSVLATLNIDGQDVLCATFGTDELWYDISSSTEANDDTVDVESGASSRYLPIEETVRLKAVDFQNPGQLHALIGGSILCPTGDVTLNVYVDGATMPTKTRDTTFASRHEWQRFGLSTRRNLGSRIEFEYQGSLEYIKGVVLEGESYERSGRRQ